jgi:bifunctional UDP-N-acetylglucosamine pyrophosphorylase/glucosamine-1-phosphate N-acetyltransferase
MSQGRELAVLVLAAGKGTRMKSGRAKVLHEVAGRPLLGFALASAKSLGAQRLIVVVGRDAALVQEAFAGEAEFVVQAEQKGTGHAVLVTKPALEGFVGERLILYGDTPLLRTETLRAMQAKRSETGADLVMLTTRLPLPGIVVRGPDGRVARVVEKPDATPAELALHEFNTGVYLVAQELLWKALAQVDDRNAQGELYVTEIVRIAVAGGRQVEALLVEDDEESLGVNTRADLAHAAAVIRRRKNAELMAGGVTLIDPAATYVDVEVEIGPDTVIEPGCVLTGPTRIGAGVHVKAHSVIESSVLADGVVIGPMAHLRPGTELGANARVGNFVEVKNSRLGAGAKADHLSYIGDADVGAGASFGCGTITVNYDGVQKHRTTVEDGAFVGCNANLIAPVTIGKDAYVAAGSTVTKDVPADALAVARERQRNVEAWRNRSGKRKPSKDGR